MRPMSNTVTLGSASNVYLASSVYIVNSGSTDHTITVANTVSVVNGGGDYGGASQAQVFINSGTSVVISKKPTDTVAGSAELYATKIARTGD
jgi:hypothetical protein